MPLPQLRPRSATELVDAAVQLGRRHYVPLLLLSALIAIPGLLVGLAGQWMLPRQTITAELRAEDLAVVPLLFVNMCWFFVGLGALVASASAAYVDGRALDAPDALRRALRRALPLIGGNVLAYLLIFVILLAGILLVSLGVAFVVAAAGAQSGEVPGALTPSMVMLLGGGMLALLMFAMILLGARYVNVTAVAVLEELGPLKALRRARALVKGNLLRAAGVVTILFVLSVAGYLTAFALGAMVLPSTELAASAAGVLSVALYPFLACLLTLLYYDLRIRREGYDLELMAQGLEAPPAGGASA